MPPSDHTDTGRTGAEHGAVSWRGGGGGGDGGRGRGGMEESGRLFVLRLRYSDRNNWLSGCLIGVWFP